MPMAETRRISGKAVCSSLAAAAAVTGLSCGESDRPLPPSAQTVTVKVREGSFDYPRIPAGRVVFRVVNTGRADHQLALVPLPESFPPIQEQLRGKRRRVVNPLASVPDLRPGARATFAADLEAGRYAFVDFTVDRDGVSHARKGEASEFRIP